MDDQILAARALRGDERAFNELFETYFPRLFRFALRRVSDEVGSNFPIAGYFTRVGPVLEVGTVRNEERLPRYSRLDVRINHTFTYAKRRLSLFAEVLNLASRTNYGPVNGFVLPSGTTIGFMQALLPLLPSAGFIFDF